MMTNSYKIKITASGSVDCHAGLRRSDWSEFNFSPFPHCGRVDTCRRVLSWLMCARSTASPSDSGSRLSLGVNERPSTASVGWKN